MRTFLRNNGLSLLFGLLFLLSLGLLYWVKTDNEQSGKSFA